jgi:uncharacterized protein
MAIDVEQSAHGAGPVWPGPVARVALRPVRAARLTGGFWEARRRTNALTSIAGGPDRLEEAGNLGNLRRAAAAVARDTAAGTGPEPNGFAGDFQFQDSDVYKWLEAACWQLACAGPDEARHDARSGDAAPENLAAAVERVVALIAAAQRPDGYLQTYYQLGGGEPWTEFGWGHELYCAGHLIQAAIAHRRATGSDTLLAVARRLADHLDSVFGPGGRIEAVCGHPLIESALVELYRETADRRYLDLAVCFIDRRGTGTLAAGVDRGHDRDPGAAFWQDHVPVREAEAVAGHAVRQLYLLAGVADVAAETGQAALREAAVRLWREMAGRKTYLTGGVGARYDWESFGDPYELPADRAYAETCAAIASVQFSWRLALATGDCRYSDLIERTLFNGFLSGVGLDGEHWLYVNPLHVRGGYSARPGDQTARRTPWFRCACCPPNAMRLLASLPYYFASTSPDGVQLHQYATGTFATDEVELAVETDYPWDGRVKVVVRRAPGTGWTLSLRIPEWAASWGVQTDGTTETDGGWLRIRRAWNAGDEVVLDLAMQPRLTAPHPRIDAVRGCVAIEYGPLVYCLESADQVPGLDLDDLALDVTAPLRLRREPELLGGISAIEATARGLTEQSPITDAVTVTAIPYALWANRGAGAMRVWLPAPAR